MADYRAITSTCSAVIHLLRRHYDRNLFEKELVFEVYSAKDFETPMETGVSLFLYRIFVNGTHRNPAGQRMANGTQYKNLLPLDLHFLLTAWGANAGLQQAIAGWMMRTIEDNSILPAGLLNSGIENVFLPKETIEIAPVELRTEDMVRIWETLTHKMYQLSVPYLARNVRIASQDLLVVSGEPVQDRVIASQLKEGPPE